MSSKESTGVSKGCGCKSKQHTTNQCACQCDNRLYVDPGVDRETKSIDYQIDGRPSRHSKLESKKIQQVNCLANEEYLLRVETSKRYLQCIDHIPRSFDLKVPYFLGIFSKSFPHDELARPDPKAIETFLQGLNVSIKYLDRIPYGGTLRLVNPSAIYSLDLVGPLKSTISLPPPPPIRSDEAAAEMLELYAMALARDIPFSDYDHSPEIQRLIHDLNQLKCHGEITSKTLFRGNLPGDLKGPYISQFLYLPFSYVTHPIMQKYIPRAPGVDFMTTFQTALSVQNGIVTETASPRIKKRYIITLRDGASYVEQDDQPQAFISAMLIILELGVPYGKGVPPSTNSHETFFVDYGRVDLWDLMNRTMRIAMMACWYQKYNFLKVRPEAVGIEIQKFKIGEGDIKLSDELLNSEILTQIYEKYGSYLLPQAYPQGAPIHPPYPASHGLVGGALVTILKAYFDENYMIDAFGPSVKGSKLVPLGYKLRIGDELNKLASNIGILRNAAGIHTRSDVNAGLALGETVAIYMLQDHVKRYSRRTTFKFHRFNGKSVTISNTIDDVTPPK